VRAPKLIVAAVLVLWAVSATACQSKAGAAAVVDGQRISDSEVAQYVQPGAQPVQQSDGSTVIPKHAVIDSLIQTQLYEKALAANGGPATQAELDQATQAVLAGHSKSDLETQVLKPAGLKSNFTDVFLNGHALTQVLVHRLGITQNVQLLAVLSKLHTNIQVSPRYGAWDAPNFSFSTAANAGLPSFVTLGALTPTATPSPTTG
jgi:SurA N-terminal domain